MNKLIVNFKNKLDENFVGTYGQNLELKLESLDYKVSLPSNMDWGYVFRIKYKKSEFDIYIQENEELENSISITINSKLSKIEKFFGFSDTKHCIDLKKVIDEIK